MIPDCQDLVLHLRLGQEVDSCIPLNLHSSVQYNTPAVKTIAAVSDRRVGVRCCGAGGSPVLCVPSCVRLQTGPRKVLQEVDITSTGDKINIYQNILLYILYVLQQVQLPAPTLHLYIFFLNI